MTDDTCAPFTAQSDGVDFSTPEAQAAVMAATALILEIREEQTGPMARKVALYERTLGLAVIPVLLRSAFVAVTHGIARGVSK